MLVHYIMESRYDVGTVYTEQTVIDIGNAMLKSYNIVFTSQAYRVASTTIPL